MHRVYEEFIESLSESADDKDLQRSMTNLLTAFEVSRFAYMYLSPSNRILPRYISNYPAVWTSHYLRKRYHQIDPIVACAGCSDTPFSWGKRLGLGESSVDENRFFDEAAEFGICSGLTIPIHDQRGGRAALTFAADEHSPILIRLADRYTRAFQLVATIYHIQARKICSGRTVVDGVRLTRREFECLQWASKGKSAWETGQILGVARRTVAFHLDNARAKLGVRTVAQAIARLAAARRPLE